jgi:hypothetical protein
LRFAEFLAAKHRAEGGTAARPRPRPPEEPA